MPHYSIIISYKCSNSMNTKIAMVLTVLGIMTLSLLTTKPLTNQVFANCSSKLAVSALMHGHGKVPGPKPVSIRALLICGDSNVGGATVNISVGGGTGISFSKSVTTNSAGLGSTPVFELGPSSNPYKVRANYAGDIEHSPATQEIEFGVKG